ncbi:copper resistance CopC/CopD family protein [Streptomyces lavendofoliae]|uniref:Transport integral membrane protein n=1 Tax=Streptomyces lavendofoliae TaxID=67314 RepID=A0A918M378_9ACTN|nr:copper resistance protein CopC [Streptomyces lavendofoliae]GGU27167.1 transport integral membrane protein [Streptomyces lavendofoliae]
MTPTAPRFGTAHVLWLILATAALLGTVLSGTASAHAALTGSDPKDGAVVATAPKGVTLTFSEQVALGDDAIRVLEPSGKRADTGELRDLCAGSVVKYGVNLHAGLPDGTYTVAWRAVSADSHPISGAFTFSIGAPSKTTVALPGEKAGGGVVGVLYGIARYVSYGGFVLLVGGAAFVLACWPRGAAVRPLQRLVVRGWVALTAATAALLLLRGPYTGADFGPGSLGAVLETKTGAALVSRLLLLGAAALFVAVLFGAYTRREDEGEKKDLTFGLAIGGTVVAAGIAGTWALSEHASAGLQPLVAMPVDILHLLAMAAWLGGLAALLVVLYREPSIERSAVRRFSRVAFGSVVVLAATGIYQSWRQVGSWSALTGTAYGRLLLLKVGLVAVLVGVAWVSRRWTERLAETAAVTQEEDAGAGEDTEAGQAGQAGEDAGGARGQVAVPDDPERAAQLARQRAALATARARRARDADPERAGLRRSVLAEAGVAVVLLAVTTVLTTTEPGRTEEEAGRAQASAPAAVPDRPLDLALPFDTGGVNGKGTVRLTLDPGRSGGNAMHVYAEGPDGRPLDVPELKVSFTLESQQIGPLPVVPDRVTAGHWTSAAVQIPMPGEWKLQVTVRTSDIDQTTIDKNVKIG